MKAALEQAGWIGLCLIIFVALWTSAIMVLGLKPFILPSPLTVWDAFANDYPTLFRYFAITAETGLIGIVVSVCLAFGVAAWFAASPRAAETFLPFAIAVKNTPVVASAPLVMLIFGRGISAGIVVVTLISFFPMLVSLNQGLQAAHRSHLELMHIYGATSSQIFWKVRFRYAISYLFAGLRTVVPAAILGALLAEWITGYSGIGSFISEAAALRDIEVLWAAIVMCMVATLILFWLTSLLQEIASPSVASNK